MSKTEFEALKPGDVVANGFGWQARIVRKTAYGYQTRPLLGTGERQELRSSKARPGKLLQAAGWSVVR